MDGPAPPAGRAVPPRAWRSPVVSGSRGSARPAGAARARCWQAGHTSLAVASSAQPATTALARLSASPSAAGSANAAPHPAMSHPAAGTRIWSPMTHCPVIATGPVSGSRRTTGGRSPRSPSGRRRSGPKSAIRPARRAAPGRLACLGKRPELTAPPHHLGAAARAASWQEEPRQRGAGRDVPGTGRGSLHPERPAAPVCYTPMSHWPARQTRGPARRQSRPPGCPAGAAGSPALARGRVPLSVVKVAGGARSAPRGCVYRHSHEQAHVCRHQAGGDAVPPRGAVTKQADTHRQALTRLKHAGQPTGPRPGAGSDSCGSCARLPVPSPSADRHHLWAWFLARSGPRGRSGVSAAWAVAPALCPGRAGATAGGRPGTGGPAGAPWVGCWL
jgi:hypothetical protein